MMPDTVPAWLRPISMHVANAVAWLSPMATNESVNAASVVSLAFAITASVIPTAQVPNPIMPAHRRPILGPRRLTNISLTKPPPALPMMPPIHATASQRNSYSVNPRALTRYVGIQNTAKYPL